MSRCRILAILLLAMGILGAEAETFVKANVTTLLGPTFFVDDAATGGTDATVNQPASGTYVRSFAGLLKPNQGLTTVTITGLGFATASNAASNDATSLTASITYLGGDGAVGGGDDVPIGSVTAGYAYAANGEYACAFDAPLVAALNITALKFQVTFTPTNATGNGSVLFKVGTIPFDGTTGPKLSVAGTVSGALPAKVSRVNLSKYQAATASSVNNQYLADFATDGVVGNANSWRALTSTDPHWAEVTLPTLTTVRSAHLYLGVDDALVPGNFKVQYFSAGSGSWVDAPGSLVTGNTSTEVNIIFTSAVSAYRYRFYSDVDGSPRVKEFALFPPNPAPGTGVEQGYPIGTDVELNLAKKRPVVASAATAPGYARLAVDGYASSGSQWQTSAVGTTTLDIDLRVATKIGSAHLYSGDGAVAPLADFTLQYWTGSAWATIAGGAITGNTSAARVISFTTAPTTSQVRLTFQNTAVSVVRELCIFPANGGVGYPLGQDVLGMAPPAEEFEAYNTALYQVINRAANLPVVVSATEPVLDPGALAGEWSQYQLLLNVGTNTYRLRHRVTGKCLAGAGLSKTPGAALLDQNYSAMPYQNWRLIPVDGTDFYLMNEWSGLVVDTQAGATAAGTALVQQTMDGATTQHWRAARQTHYPKKGMAGGVDNASPFQASWAYNWGRTSGTSLPVDVVFHPMQWGNFNWDHGSTQGPLEQFISRWRREDKALHLLGFNEPDGAEQADLTTAQAIAMWPRLERMDVPLVSPVTINPDVAWMNDFMTQAQSRGYRIDVVAAHRYPDPNSGNSDALVNVLQSLYNTWDRPVWLTEFSVVD